MHPIAFDQPFQRLGAVSHNSVLYVKDNHTKLSLSYVLTLWSSADLHLLLGTL